MKKNLMKGVVAASASLLAFGAAANSLSEQWDLVPYVGADIQVRHMEFKKGFGDNITKNNYPQGNVYVGVKLNQYTGIEAGFERTKAQKKNTALLGSDNFLGTILFAPLPNDQTRIKTNTKMSAFYANLVGFLPVFCEEYRLQLIGSLGIAHSNLKMTLDLPDDGVHRVFSKKKWVPKIGVGLQHMLNCQLGVRAMVNWEGTKTSGIKPLNAPQSELRASVKNSFNYGLGLFYNFK